MEVDVGIRPKNLGPSRPICRGLVHGLQHFIWNRRCKKLVGFSRVIAQGSPGACFVFDLHDQHRSLRIYRLQVLHESSESAYVRFQGGPRKRRGRVHSFPILVDYVSVLFRIELHPLGHVVLAAVLPCAKPEQNKVNAMRAGLRENTVDLRVVELTLSGLELFPVDRDFECIGMQILDRGPHFWKHCRPVARVVGLRTKHQKWRTIDHQGIAAILVNDTRDWVFIHLRIRG
jgi:hypothetical protein